MASQDYERKMAAEESELGMTSRPSEERGAPQRVEEEMDQHRILVNKIRKKVYENVLIRFITAKHQFVTSDIVHEETIPDTSLVLPRGLFCYPPTGSKIIPPSTFHLLG